MSECQYLISDREVDKNLQDDEEDSDSHSSVHGMSDGEYQSESSTGAEADTGTVKVVQTDTKFAEA